MAETKISDEVLEEHIERLGDDLGHFYDALWNEFAWLQVKWQEYCELFGTSPERVELLNSAAPLFFRMIQRSLWEDVLLSITRLTDSPKSCGKFNLTVNALPKLLPDESSRDSIADLAQKATAAAEFARDWRHRHIAHRDMGIALGEALVPLSPASRQMVREAITALHGVINAVCEIYLHSTLVNDVITPMTGAVALLYVIRDGVDAERNKDERLISGKLLEEDLTPPKSI
jgi:hypothetical protein